MGVNEVVCVQSVEVEIVQNIWNEKIDVLGREVEFKLDSESQVNLLPFNIVKMLNLDCNLVKTNTNLEAYGGFKLKPVDKININCSTNKKK